MFEIELRRLQEQLCLISILDDRYQVPNTDGKYTAATAAAVRAFQEVNGLIPHGEPDAITVSQIEKAYREVAEFFADPQPISPFPSPYYLLKSGESNRFVTLLQILLQEIGEGYTVPESPTLTGIYDPPTVSCVKRWQQALGLTEDGTVDRVCWDRLAVLYNTRLL